MICNSVKMNFTSINASDRKKVSIMTNQWNRFLSERRKKTFEFGTGPNWLTMNGREYMLSECLNLLNKLIRTDDE